jgi:hypothetical protein
VVLYTAVGGLKATFLTDFLHTAIALILIIYFTIAVLTNKEVGGLGGLYDKVVATAGDNYIPGNYEGSLLTFKSKNAIIWGLILKFGNLALVVMVSELLIPCQSTPEAETLSIRIPHSGKSHSQPKFRRQCRDIILLRWPCLVSHGASEQSLD